MELTGTNVRNIVMDSLYKPEELKDPHAAPADAKLGECIGRMAFHPDRLESHRADITSLLEQLPLEFRRTGGGGWSFLNACTTASGNQWGEQRDVDTLFCLGNALGLCKTLVPRLMWSMFPGGVPYVMIEL